MFYHVDLHLAMLIVHLISYGKKSNMVIVSWRYNVYPYNDNLTIFKVKYVESLENYVTFMIWNA